MLAYGDADLVLAMNADTDTNSVNADADAVINANADTAVIGLTADTAIDITADTYTVRGQLHHLPLTLHAVTSTRGPHASHIYMHAMLAYGDIDLVLSMKTETNINATIAINADADTDVIAINTGSITSPPDAAPRHDSGQSSSGTPVQPARQRRARTCFLRPCPKKYSPHGGKILLLGTAPCLSPHATVL